MKIASTRFSVWVIGSQLREKINISSKVSISKVRVRKSLAQII